MMEEILLPLFYGRNRKGDGEAACEQDDGVDRPQDDVLLGGGGMEILGVLVADIWNRGGTCRRKRVSP